MISLDSETTGTDFFHGARPFFVTSCDEDGKQTFWEWSVDPLTRMPEIPQSDLVEIETLLRVSDWSMFDDEVCDRHALVLQNPRFDCKALHFAGIDGSKWPWRSTYCTLMAGHLLASNKPHDLTSMLIQYCGINLSPFEKQLERCVDEARKFARREFPEWRIAKEGDPMMPSAKGGSKKGEKGVESEKPWRFDMWLPRALAVVLGLSPDHEWWTVLSEYSNADSAGTMQLFKVQRQELRRRGLWGIYLERMRLLPAAYDMEMRGVTVNRKRLKEKQAQFQVEFDQAGKKCQSLAWKHGHELELPSGASPNNSLRAYCFDILKLPVLSRSAKTKEPALTKEVFDAWIDLAEGESLEFVKEFKGRRDRGKALEFMASYERFGLGPREDVQLNLEETSFDDWLTLYPSANPTATATLRWSMSGPNLQQVSHKEEFGLRSVFGPVEGREWWSFDGKNLELRIPAYESGEADWIAVFDRPKDPPYFGSVHLVVFDLLHPEKFAQHGAECKDVYDATWYYWVKGGNFAVIYGAQRDTADRAYHQRGAYDKIGRRFPKIAALSLKQIHLAESRGYVETIPDKSVDPSKGYPIYCSRSDNGGILPTVPLNYHIQSTACWWIGRAMTRVCEFFRHLNTGGEFAGRKWHGGYHLVLQVHDELVIDLPRGKGPKPWLTNLAIASEVKRLMEQGGDDIGVPTPVSMGYHETDWDAERAVSAANLGGRQPAAISLGNPLGVAGAAF